MTQSHEFYAYFFGSQKFKLDICPLIIKIHYENLANVRIQRRWKRIEINYERKTPQKH